MQKFVQDEEYYKRTLKYEGKRALCRAVIIDPTHVDFGLVIDELFLGSGTWSYTTQEKSGLIKPSEVYIFEDRDEAYRVGRELQKLSVMK